MRLGIDPGVTGAIALINGKDVVDCWDMPTHTNIVKGKDRKTGKQVDRFRKTVDPLGFFDIINEVLDKYTNEIHIIIERQQPNMGQGIDSPLTAGTVMFNYGKLIATIELCVGSDYTIVHPVTWKKEAGLRKTAKIEAIDYCVSHFETNNFITLKKHSGRADAILIAYYGL